MGIVIRLMERPSKQCRQVVKHIQGTIEYEFLYTKDGKTNGVVWYIDSDIARDVNDKRKTTRKELYLG